MRIEESRLSYAATHVYSERRERIDRLRVEWREAPRAVEVPVAMPAIHPETTFEGDPRMWLARLVVEALLGGKFPATRPVARLTTAAVRPGAAREMLFQSAPQWSLTLTHTESYEERERLVVKASGMVRTARGAEIHFDAGLTLERSFREESGFTQGAGNARLSDPLFLDTASGRALLVDDANGDGKLTDDSEMFGARSGDGFAELARLDTDGNGWIDEGDPAFGQLRLRLSDGGLQPLEPAGIGALAATGVAGEFQFKNEANELTGVVRRTGVYLTEDGRAGAIRQIDLVSQ